MEYKIPSRCCGMERFMNEERFRKIPEKYWGYAYVRPRTEKKVKTALEAQGIPVYLPLKPKARMHHATKVVSYLPLIPGYIFLNADDDERRKLKTDEKNIVHVELLRDTVKEEKFLSELNALHSCELLAASEPVLINPDILPGDDVEVISGPLAGLKAQVLRRAADALDTIIINLPILNLHAEYPVSPETLKKITNI